MQRVHQTPRVYPAALSSQPPPQLPPPSPMDFMYEFLLFQHGNHGTNERIEYYQHFIMNLLGELKTLQEMMCTSCQQRCASSKATRSGNQSIATSTDSTIDIRPMKTCNVDIPTSPRMPETDVSLVTPASGSSSLGMNETISSDSSSLSIERINESDNPIFYTERDVVANTTFDVTFAHSFHHKNCVYCVRFSPDGRYMAVGTGIKDKDSSILIYEVESHKKYCELREYASQYGSYTRPLPCSLCFSSDGRYLAVADAANRMIIWDVPNKRIRSIFHGESVSKVRFSPDGRLVALHKAKGLLILSMRDNSKEMVSEGKFFDFNPGGRLIATGDHISPMILDVRTGKAVKRWNEHGSYPRSAKFTLDGRGLLCVYNDRIEQWDMSDAVPVLIRKFDVQDNYNHFYRAFISPDHRLLAFSNQLWDVNSGKRRYTLHGHNGIIDSVDFSAGGTYLAMGGWDGFVSLWKYNWT